MRHRRSSYTSYSIACAVVWATILSAVALRQDRTTLRRVWPVCGGWWLGWLSATIARRLYPR